METQMDLAGACPRLGARSGDRTLPYDRGMGGGTGRVWYGGGMGYGGRGGQISLKAAEARVWILQTPRQQTFFQVVTGVLLGTLFSTVL